MSRHPQGTPPITWLASFPRSGNTFLRTMLWHLFGLPSTSVYPADLDHNETLEKYVGHLPYEEGEPVPVSVGTPPLIKTHEKLESIGQEDRVIYVIRDGRAAIVSLWEYYDRALPLMQLVRGGTNFRLWAGHYRSWEPVLDSRALVVRYEDLVADRDNQVQRLSEFLETAPIADTVPDRNTMSNIDGRFIRRSTDWREVLTGEELEVFNELNRDVLTEFGYL